MKVFEKARAGARREDYEMEAAGLRWLGEGGHVRIPEVLGVGSDHPSISLQAIPN